uniref:USP domain-containing protein n=1 Tax=Moniliophthora roreri TaxID=221103 RepID=A0A0W0G8J1_MONRR
MAPPTASENESVGMLSAMMGGKLDDVIALRVLRKFNGNVDRAADAMLAGDRGVEEPTPQRVSSAPPNTVIDLTGDDQDEEMSRALQMSMETDMPETKFGPSNRAPDPNWAVVPTNTQQQLSNEDENLKQAIEASLAIPEESESLELSDMVRQDGRPVSIRPDLAGYVYAALVIQALFHVPQLRERVSQYRARPQAQKTKEDAAVDCLADFYCHLDLVALSTLCDNNVFERLNAIPNDANQPLSEISAAFLGRLATLIENRIPPRDPSRGRLINFLAGRLELVNGRAHLEQETKPLATVPLSIGRSESCPNELIARLSAMLNQYKTDGSSIHEGIQEPSEIVVFQLNQDRDANKSLASLESFSFPKSLYLDQFLLENFELVHNKRIRQSEIREKVSQLQQQKNSLTTFNNKDIIKDLGNSLYYYENVARVGDDPARQESLTSTAEKLRKTLTNLEAVVENINKEIEQLQNEYRSIFDCHELQKHQYDLRAVLMHTGVSGRKQLYSYVQDRDGTWWKTVDHTVTEATEADVLMDPTGLHLRAGPYMLIYSRSIPIDQLSDPLPWPRELVETVKSHNQKLLASLGPEPAQNYEASQALTQEESKKSKELGRTATMFSEKSREASDVSMIDLTASSTTTNEK